MSNIRPLQNAVVARRVVALDDVHSMVLALLVMEVVTPIVIAVTVILTVHRLACIRMRMQVWVAEQT